MSVGRGLMPEAYCGDAFLIAAAQRIPSLPVYFKVNRKADGCKDSTNREQNIKLA